MLFALVAFLLPVRAEFDNGGIERLDWDLIQSPAWKTLRTDYYNNFTYLESKLYGISGTTAKRIWLANNASVHARNASWAKLVANRTQFIANFENDLIIREQAANNFFLTNPNDTTRSSLEKAYNDSGIRVKKILDQYKYWSPITNRPHYPEAKNLIYLGKELAWELNSNLFNYMIHDQNSSIEFTQWYVQKGKNLGFK